MSIVSVNFQAVQFLTSAATLAQCPADQGMEVAFCGRSNAGKSSALNALTGHKNLARTSRTPGRTQLLNFFALSQDQRLVDLPGYGYAKVSTSVKRDWHRHLDEYLRHRQCLRGLVLLMDIRHPYKPFDQMMMDWSTQSGVPLHILLTKADKLTRQKQQTSLTAARGVLPEGMTLQLFSSAKHLGIEQLAAQVSFWLAAGKQ